MIASAGPDAQAKFLKSLTPGELDTLQYLFEFWALPHQVPPQGDWRTWVIMGGRGSGKTRAGAEWIRQLAERPRENDEDQTRRFAIVADTLDQAREISVFGDSGIMAISPLSFRPDWIAGRRMLVWPNGATAQLFSANDPESLRGPQFDAAWADELGKWRYDEATWDMLQFGMRLGQNPRACVTTTPRKSAALIKLLEADSTVLTTATTYDNAANLAPGFLEEISRRFDGTTLGRQEVMGEMPVDIDGALWKKDMFDAYRVKEPPEMQRIVVAVDPPAKGRATSDDCGIIVVGTVMQGRAETWQSYVLEDATVSAAGPSEWATAAIAAMVRHGADRLVAEVNQGGEMVESVMRQIDPNVPFRGVHATRGKVARAEPIAALYEQGRVHHVRHLTELEAQMTQMTTKGFRGRGSPDRVDALVWALHDLVIVPGRNQMKPQIRNV